MNDQNLQIHEQAMLMQYRADMSNSPTPQDQESPIDWVLFFHVVVRLLAIAAMFYVIYCTSIYFQLFGISAVALFGQFAVAMFFTYAVLTGNDDVETLLNCLGMFFVIGMF